MRIAQRLLQPTPCFSFEFFPPRTPAGVENLMQTLRELVELQPAFVSVTYGAGGSTQSVTSELVARIRNDVGIEAMAHLTCVGHTGEELQAVLDRLRDLGIENILLLRGDPPRPAGSNSVPIFQPVPGGFRYVSDLVSFVRERCTV